MIKLSPKVCGFEDIQTPFIGVVVAKKSTIPRNEIVELVATEQLDKFQADNRTIVFDVIDIAVGEILLVFPQTSLAHRFFRPSEKSNTILITERCDQYCQMCSQPPKSKDYLHWKLYEKAIELFPINSVVGISGGEPTLYKNELFNFITKVLVSRPDIEFHVLTNAQHFDSDDLNNLSRLRENIVWGIPIYAASAETHDKIVGKKGAYGRLFESFSYLLESGARVELRTVVLKDNTSQIPKLAKYIGRYFQWVEVWSIMQLEKIGFAKIDWELKFEDTSVFFDFIEDALVISKACGINAQLFNFPTCTVPKEHQILCVDSISNWKKRYIAACNSCSAKTTCCGFFEWYNELDGFKKIRGIKS